MVVIQDRLSSVALTAFLCYLFKYALAHTHKLKQLHSQANTHAHIHTHTHHTHSYWLTEKDRHWSQHTHTQMDTHTHIHHTRRTLVCTSFSLTSSFCQWCTCVFVSKCSAKRVTSKNDLLSSSCFSFKKKKTSNLYSKTWASQVDRLDIHWIIIHPVHTEGFMSLQKKKKHKCTYCSAQLYLGVPRTHSLILGQYQGF